MGFYQLTQHFSINNMHLLKQTCRFNTRWDLSAASPTAAAILIYGRLCCGIRASLSSPPLPPQRPLGLFSAVLPIAPLSRQIPSRRRRQSPAVRPPYRSRRHRINSLPPDGPRLESASCLRRINIYLASCPMSPVNAPPSVIVKCRRRRRILLVLRSFKLPSRRQGKHLHVYESASVIYLF